MIVKQFPSGPFFTNAYLLVCDGSAAIFDPAPGSAEAIRSAAAGLVVEKIIISHSHWDHIGDCAELKREYNVPVYIHAADATNLEAPGSDGLPLIVLVEGVKPDEFLEEGQEIAIGSERLLVMHAPGHARGQCIFYCEQAGFVLTGDVVFRGAMGRIDLPTSEPEKMQESVARVASLPPDTVIYPGHGDSTTVGEEHWLSDVIGPNDLEV